jgi:predicted outer membrane protein
VLIVLNDGEVDQGNIALDKSSDAPVLSFAQSTVGDFTNLTTSAMALAITPADSAASSHVKAEADAMIATLNATSSSTFDEVYVDGQVTSHTNALDLIDHDLAPSAEDAALVSFIASERIYVVSHLGQAQSLADSL